MHINRAPEISAPPLVPSQSAAQTKRGMPSVGTLVGWSLFIGACVASVYFMYTGDIQRILEKIKDLGVPGIALMVGIYTAAMVFLVPGTVLNLGAGYM